MAAASQHLALLLARRCSFRSQAPRTVRPWQKISQFQVTVSNDRTTRISSQTSLITLHPHHPSHPSAVACFLVDGSLRQYSHWVAQPRIPASRAVITRKVGMGCPIFLGPLRDRNALAQSEMKGTSRVSLRCVRVHIATRHVDHDGDSPQPIPAVRFSLGVQGCPTLQTPYRDPRRAEAAAQKPTC